MLLGPPDRAAMGALNPRAVVGYLKSTGWEQRDGYGKNAVVFGIATDRLLGEVLVPVASQSEDFPKVMEVLVADLARLEDRSPYELLADLSMAAYDVVRVRSPEAELDRLDPAGRRRRVARARTRRRPICGERRSRGHETATSVFRTATRSGDGVSQCASAGAISTRKLHYIAAVPVGFHALGRSDATEPWRSFWTAGDPNSGSVTSGYRRGIEIGSDGRGPETISRGCGERRKFESVLGFGPACARKRRGRPFNSLESNEARGRATKFAPVSRGRTVVDRGR